MKWLNWKNIETHLQQLPQKNKPPFFWSDSVLNLNNCSAPTYNSFFLKKNRPPFNLQRGGGIVLYPDFFGTYWYLYFLCILEWKWRTPIMVGTHARKVFRDYNNKLAKIELAKNLLKMNLLKMNFRAWQLFSKTLPQKCWP